MHGRSAEQWVNMGSVGVTGYGLPGAGCEVQVTGYRLKKYWVPGKSAGLRVYSAYLIPHTA